ncbi:pilus assembly protein PilZ [Desulfovibrio psychrotolerans]|uniref:Pilus assembly protein PilZ n=2 Tax=Desulfovibrio psychrotolerans TaxID=415242 RepID=A0A7J0BQF6_9BACT|nr:pilus assembly protein PilZ [Desulfovibrio psychrotolerans]
MGKAWVRWYDTIYCKELRIPGGDMAVNQGVAVAHRRHAGITLDVQPGTRMLLSVNGSDNRHGTELVGLNPYEYLILKMPLVPGIRSRMLPGEPLTVRFMRQGTIIGFRTHVISQITKPGALVFVEYPDVLEQFELRTHKRLKCLIPAEAHSPLGVQRGAVVDLSAGGCKMCFEVKSSDPFRRIGAGDMFVLRANLFSGGDSTLSCICRNVEMDRATMIVGASFADLEAQDTKRLQEYIETVSSFL